MRLKLNAFNKRLATLNDVMSRLLNSEKILIYTPLTKLALRICFEAHKAQSDKSGIPYVFHPFYVAQQMKDEKTTVVALLHDVLEDTDITEEDLRNYGFAEEIISTLLLLTRNDEEDYFAYINKIKKDPDARAVKLADLKHNSDLSRLDSVDQNALKRFEKYQTAIRLLLT